MDSNTVNVPAIQKAINALAGFKNKGMTFARREDLENVSQQYQPLVTIVEFQAKDFTRLGNDKSYYPSKGATNRIGDAAGVSFIEGVGGTREEGNATAIKVVEHKNGDRPSYFQIEGHYRIIGTAQGERLKPDGTPRRSSVCEYGFDVVQRTNEAILNDLGNEKPILTTEIACRKKFLELQKFGVQKARTGAELAVIRELVGMNTGFDKADVEKGCQMLFSQVIENNTFKVQVLAEVMKTPDGRAAVTQALFGATRTVFGPGAVLPPGEQPKQIPHTVDAQTGELAAQVTVEEGQLPLDTFDDGAAMPAAPEKTPLEKIREMLAGYRGKMQASPKATKLLDDTLAKKDATAEEISSVIDRFEAWMQKQQEGGAK
jgi:hypothetical protein